jgi:hypothetical protein
MRFNYLALIVPFTLLMPIDGTLGADPIKQQGGRGVAKNPKPRTAPKSAAVQPQGGTSRAAKTNQVSRYPSRFSNAKASPLSRQRGMDPTGMPSKCLLLVFLQNLSSCVV